MKPLEALNAIIGNPRRDSEDQRNLNQAVTELENFIYRVEREMIPRPDADEARKAVDELMYEVEQKFTSPASHREYHRQKMWKARAAVLKLMGVE